MRVQQVLMPGSGAESWTLLGEDHVPVEPVERFLAFLAAVERSPNTVKAYAHDLKDWFGFLAGRGLDWRAVTMEDVAGFVAWPRLPPAARDGQVTVLPTVLRHGWHWRCADRDDAGWSTWLIGELVQTVLAHVTKNSPQRRRTVGLAAPAPRPRVLTVPQTQAILDGCTRLRDRLLFAVLLDTGTPMASAAAPSCRSGGKAA
jgi:site-specific recombinase XerD